MAITDLLAEISGQKPLSKAEAPQSSAKRKADGDHNGSGKAKAQKTGSFAGQSSPSKPPPSSSAVPSKLADKAPPSSKNYEKLPTHPGRPPLPHTSSKGKAKPHSGPTSKLISGSNGTAGTSINRPRPQTTGAASSGDKAEPKRGSFAEVMARAQKAQAVMGQVGKIQHKPLEKVPSKKERDEIRAEMRATVKRQLNPSTRMKATSASASRKPLAGKAARPSAKSRQPPVEGPRPAKKAATATTGYKGTARPRAGTSSKRPVPRGGAILEGPRRQRSRYEDEEDPDMDDFIEYDDDEEADERAQSRRRRYSDGEDYDSAEDSSDMEAGAGDIDEEERRAALIAKNEDVREEMLERQRRQEKEARMRRGGY